MHCTAVQKLSHPAAGYSATWQGCHEVEPSLAFVPHCSFHLERSCSCLCEEKKEGKNKKKTTKRNGSEHSVPVSFFIAVIKVWIVPLECPYLK